MRDIVEEGGRVLKVCYSPGYMWIFMSFSSDHALWGDIYLVSPYLDWIVQDTLSRYLTVPD